RGALPLFFEDQHKGRRVALAQRPAQLTHPQCPFRLHEHHGSTALSQQAILWLPPPPQVLACPVSNPPAIPGASPVELRKLHRWPFPLRTSAQPAHQWHVLNEAR